MPEPRATVVIPTLEAGERLSGCLKALAAQTLAGFEVIVVDNSGVGRAKAQGDGLCGVRVIENVRNVGFGAAINQGIRESQAPFVAALNDDAQPAPGWLEALLSAMEARPDAGVCASRVMLDDSTLDSAGLLLCPDGSSKQRGHGCPAPAGDTVEEVLLASGAAALLRRTMLDEVGLFDERFFLYCEDTDLGLRAQWAGWRCLYVPGAVVWHGYSASAGRASRVKAYLVERNRIFVAVKNFPARMVWAVPWHAAMRYLWHVHYMMRGVGKAAEFQRESPGAWRLAWYVLKSHAALLRRLPELAADRRRIRRGAALTGKEFQEKMRRHSISPRQVAAQ